MTPLDTNTVFQCLGVNPIAAIEGEMHNMEMPCSENTSKLWYCNRKYATTSTGEILNWGGYQLMRDNSVNGGHKIVRALCPSRLVRLRKQKEI